MISALATILRAPRRGLARALALALFTLSAGCARAVELRAETVATGPGSAFWVAGTEGFAAFSSGKGALQRRDYPRAPGAPDYAYEPFVLPAAIPLVTAGQTFLFTRNADVLLWQESAWSRVEVALAPADAGHMQLDAALEAPDGRILIQLHSDLLVWATPAELRRGFVRRERTPSYLPWLGFLDGALHAVGWAPGGSRRAVLRYDGPEKWTTLGLLPERELLLTAGDLIRMPGGPLAVVSSAGLYLQGKEGFTELVSADALMKEPAVVAGPPAKIAADRAPEAKRAVVAEPDPRAPDAPAAPPAPAAKIVASDPVASPAQVPENPPTPPPTTGYYLSRVLDARGAGLLLVVGGPRYGVLTLGAQGNRFTPCAEALAMTGAVPGPDGILLVTTDAALFELRPGGCKRVAPPLLGQAGLPGSPPSVP